MDTRVGPPFLPTVEVGLRIFQVVKAESLERRLLRMTHAGFDLSLAIRMSNTAGHGHDAIVGQHVAIERIKYRIVYVCLQHPLLEIVQDDEAWSATQAAKTVLVKPSPHFRGRVEKK